MHLRSISLKGFKSFPDRTKLEFSPGVSVVVGPNGSGKSNITDAVLWALGEQSPLAVRGQSMQDVIFAGAHGVHDLDRPWLTADLDTVREGGAALRSAGEQHQPGAFALRQCARDVVGVRVGSEQLGVLVAQLHQRAAGTE